MKIINYILVLFLLSSLTTEDQVPGKIKDEFYSRIKTILDKRGPFNYKNNILFPVEVVKKTLIIDRLDVNKVNEVVDRYNLDRLAINQIKSIFFQTEPNVYRNFNFPINSPNLNQILDYATFTEYIGFCFKENNVINYIILHLSVKVQFKYKKNSSSTYSVISKRRPLNSNEKEEANKLVLSYSADYFNLMFEELEPKETIIIPDNLEVQTYLTTTQVITNGDMEAEITDFGDVEIRKSDYKQKASIQSKCESIQDSRFYDNTWDCRYGPLCFERDNVYLIADQKSESTCTKLKELRKEKRNVRIEVYTDGSMSIKDAFSGGVLFYIKPVIKGQAPFNLSVTKHFELQMLDSKNVAVWTYAPVASPTMRFRRSNGEDWI